MSQANDNKDELYDELDELMALLKEQPSHKPVAVRSPAPLPLAEATRTEGEIPVLQEVVADVQQAITPPPPTPATDTADLEKLVELIIERKLQTLRASLKIAVMSEIQSQLDKNK